MDVEVLPLVVVVHILGNVELHAAQGVHELGHGLQVRHKVVVGVDAGKLAYLGLQPLYPAAGRCGGGVDAAYSLEIPGHIHSGVPGDGQAADLAAGGVKGDQDQGVCVAAHGVQTGHQKGVDPLPPVERAGVLRRDDVAAGGSFLTGLGGVLPAAAEGQHHHGGHDHRHRRQGDLQHPGPVDDEGDPLLHGPFPLAHGGGRPQQPRQRPAGDDHGHQGLAVVQPPVLPQPPDGAVVAGQLAVPAAEHRRPPHQGVVPVQGQAHASDQTPQLVPVAAVGLLVDQDVLQPPGVQGRLIEVDGRAEQPHQAGGGEPLRQVHPGPAGGGQLRRGNAPPPLPQGEVKFQVGQEQDRPHQGCPGVQGPAPEGHGPDAVILAVGDGLLPLLQIHLHAVDGVILAGGLLEPLVRGGPQGEVFFFGVDVVQGPQYREGCHIRSGGLGGGACRRTLGWGLRRGGQGLAGR